MDSVFTLSVVFCLFSFPSFFPLTLKMRRALVRLSSCPFSTIPVVAAEDGPKSVADTANMNYYRAWAQKYGPIFVAPFFRPRDVHVWNFEGVEAAHKAAGIPPFKGISVMCWSERLCSSTFFSNCT